VTERRVACGVARDAVSVETSALASAMRLFDSCAEAEAIMHASMVASARPARMQDPDRSALFVTLCPSTVGVFPLSPQ
jgi:hypothetical protein